MLPNHTFVGHQEVFRVRPGHLELLEGARVEELSYYEATLHCPGQAPQSLAFRKQAGAISRTEDITHYLREPAMRTVSTLVKLWSEPDRYTLRLYDDAPSQEVRRDGKLYLLPRSLSQPKGELEVVFDLEEAKRRADTESFVVNQVRIVHRYGDGYVVLPDADLWDYFGKGDRDNEDVVYRVDPEVE